MACFLLRERTAQARIGCEISGIGLVRLVKLVKLVMARPVSLVSLVSLVRPVRIVRPVKQVRMGEDTRGARPGGRRACRVASGRGYAASFLRVTRTSVRTTVWASGAAAGQVTNAASIARNHQIATPPIKYQVFTSDTRSKVRSRLSAGATLSKTGQKNEGCSPAGCLLPLLPCQSTDSSVPSIDTIVCRQ